MEIGLPQPRTDSSTAEFRVCVISRRSGRLPTSKRRDTASEIRYRLFQGCVDYTTQVWRLPTSKRRDTAGEIRYRLFSGLCRLYHKTGFLERFQAKKDALLKIGLTGAADAGILFTRENKAERQPVLTRGFCSQRVNTRRLPGEGADAFAGGVVPAAFFVSKYYGGGAYPEQVRNCRSTNKSATAN